MTILAPDNSQDYRLAVLFGPRHWKSCDRGRSSRYQGSHRPSPSEHLTKISGTEFKRAINTQASAVRAAGFVTISLSALAPAVK
jgi:hypothetical protein